MLLRRAFQAGALTLSVAIAVAVVYVAHRRGVELAAPPPEPQAPALVVSPASRPVGSDAGLSASSAQVQEREPRARKRRNLGTLYGLQGPSTKADPHLAKALYQEVARNAEARRPDPRDGGAPR